MVQQYNREGQQFGNYRLERLLGRGGFAEVYLGYHLRLQRQAAIKVLHTHLSEQEIAAFQREAQIIAALNHPSIVRIFDFDVQHGIPFLVMDYLPHGTLRQRHSRGERVPLSTVISYTKQIADALQYAHDQRLIHRDVKPENMLIGLRNEVVLSDFGIAAIAHSTTSRTAQESIGTIPYMAPEQIQAQACTASDQYALGIVVYEWLTGDRPFDGSYAEIFAKHLMTPPPSLRRIVPTLSAEVEQVILTALTKQPERRFASVSAFATALEQASQDMMSVEQSHPLGISSPICTPPSSDAGTPSPELQQLVDLSITNITPSDRPAPLPTSVFQTPSALPIPAQTTGKPRARVSRRTVLVGAAGVVAIGSVGIGVFAISQQPPQGQLLVYRGHLSGVNVVAWSPDGKHIASASDDGTVQVWNANDGAQVFTYQSPRGRVNAVAWSPNGQRIASASGVGILTDANNKDNVVQVWNAIDGSNVFTYQGHSRALYGGVNAVAWSLDGSRIASASDDVQVWNASDGSNVLTYKGGSIQGSVDAVAWSPDGNRIASDFGDEVLVWNASNGSNICSYRDPVGLEGAIAWSPDGKRIASSSYDNTVQIWDASDGSSVFTYRGSAGRVDAIPWSLDGKYIASCSHYINTVQVWNASDGNNVFTYQGHSGGVNAVAWSPDGEKIASASNDKTVQVWHIV